MSDTEESLHPPREEFDSDSDTESVDQDPLLSESDSDTESLPESDLDSLDSEPLDQDISTEDISTEDVSTQEPKRDTSGFDTWFQSWVDIPVDASDNWKYFILFAFFYLLCWAMVDKTNINIYSNLLCLINSIFTSIFPILFLITKNTYYTRISNIAFIVFCILELILGTLYYPSRMPIGSAYIHHTFYALFVFYVLYYTKYANITMLYGFAEIPTVILTMKRMFSIHNPILDLTELITFFIVRIVGWFGYGIYLHTHIHSWFKYIYGILTVVFGGLHVLWFGKSFLKFSKKYM